MAAVAPAVVEEVVEEVVEGEEEEEEEVARGRDQLWSSGPRSNIILVLSVLSVRSAPTLETLAIGYCSATVKQQLP